MPTVPALLTAASATMQAAVPPDCRVSPWGHPDLTVDDLARFRLPCILVATRRIDQSADPGDGRVDAIVYIDFLVADQRVSDLSRQMRCLALLETVALTGRLAQWGLTDVGPAEFRGAEAVTAAPLAATGIALWRVMFAQTLRLGPVEPGDPLPSQLYLGFVPDVGPEHVDDYWQVSHLPELDPIPPIGGE